MAVLFSAVTVAAGNEESELLVGGIPREYDDLEGWTKFDDFLESITEECEVSVKVEAYLYGEGETFRATPEEVAYFMKRMEMNERFLSDRCDHIEDTGFTFEWSPGELYEMEMK